MKNKYIKLLLIINSLFMFTNSLYADNNLTKKLFNTKIALNQLDMLDADKRILEILNDVGELTKEGAFELQLRMIKFKSKVDINDDSVFVTLDKLNECAFQADRMSSSCINEFQKTLKKMNEGTLVNGHIIFILMAYQEYISAKDHDTNVQLSVSSHLLAECLVFKRIPVLALIYFAEASHSNRKFEEEKKILKYSLSIYKDSIPLQVYFSQIENDDKLKEKLLKEYPNHWLVKERLK